MSDDGVRTNGHRRGEVQWELGYFEPLNPAERYKRDQDPLDVYERIVGLFPILLVGQTRTHDVGKRPGGQGLSPAHGVAHHDRVGSAHGRVGAEGSGPRSLVGSQAMSGGKTMSRVQSRATRAFRRAVGSCHR